MDMSFDTLLIGLYCIIDQWLKTDGQRFIRPQGGRPPDFTDAEMLTLILAHQLAHAQWHERHWLRWLKHEGYRAWFPHLPTQSAYNRRARNCWQVVNALRIYLAQELIGDLPPEAVTDSTPVKVRHWRRFGRRHLALPEAELGYCAAKREFFYGYRLLVLVSRQGVVIDWVLLPGSADERDGLDALLSDEEQWCLWGDKGFLDAARQQRLAAEQGIALITPKRANQAQQLPVAVRKQLQKVRPIVETTFAQAKEYLHLEQPRVKTWWGLVARLMAKLTALAVMAWANTRRGVSPLSYVNFAW